MSSIPLGFLLPNNMVIDRGASSSLSSDWRPTIPQVTETICEKSQGGTAIDDIKEQGIRGIESETERDGGSLAQGLELSQNIESSLKFQCANFDVGQVSEIATQTEVENCKRMPSRTFLSKQEISALD